MDTFESYSDAELLKRLRQEGEPAFAEMYRRYSNTLFTTAFHFLKDRTGAEDAVQEIFLDVWKRRHRLEIQSSLEAYLKQSIRYFVLREYRREKKSLNFYSRLADITKELAAEDSSILRDLNEILEKVLSRLPADQQAIFRLNKVQGFTYPEIADQLHISVKTVEKKMSLSLKFIRSNMQEAVLALLFFSCSIR